MLKNKCQIIIIFLLAMLPAKGFASSEAFLAVSNKCTKYLSYYEKTHKIPDKLLKAVAMVESGRWSKELGSVVPWPWAVNAEGKAYHFNNKQEAVRAVARMLQQGMRSIDVGCMQINLRYHPTAFRTIEQAFEPKHNIEYAANFLKNNYARHQSWKKAVASYHSETAEHGHPYAHKVINFWKKAHKGPDMKKPTNRIEAVRRSNSYSSSRYAKMRRRSDIFIKVHNQDADADPKYSMVEDISVNAVSTFNKGKEIKSVSNYIN
jgi:hypothetical protein